MRNSLEVAGLRVVRNRKLMVCFEHSEDEMPIRHQVENLRRQWINMHKNPRVERDQDFQHERSRMLRHAPEKCHRQSSWGWLNFRRPTPCSLVQSGTDTEPLDTNRRCSPRFFPYMGRPGLGASPGYKTSPHPSYLADSLCLLAHPSPGVLPESDRAPNKGLHQRSLEVALSSRCVF